MLSATPAPPVPPAPKNPDIDPIHPTRNMSTPPDGPILEPKPAPYPGGSVPVGALDWEKTDLRPSEIPIEAMSVYEWQGMLQWPAMRNPQPVPGSPRDPRPSAPDPGPIPKPNPYPTGPRG